MTSKYIFILGVVVGSLITPLGAQTVVSTPSSGTSTSGTVVTPNEGSATVNPETTMPNSGPVQSPESGTVTSPNGTGAYQPNTGH